MTATTNPITGLQESYNEYYRVPEVKQRSIGALRLAGQPRALHTVPLGPGRSLDFFAQLGRSEELIVTFHGANSERTNFYPRFERVASMRKNFPAIIAFADPTVRLSEPMLLSWYLGGPAWDPFDEIDIVIRAAMRKAGAKRVVFIGGSGGGFAALRASSRHPGSMAFVQSPQTDIRRYIPSVVNLYFETMWPGWDQAQLLEAFPERFDMVRHYQKKRPENFVYYLQSDKDATHIERHYNPFKAAFGVKTESGIDATGRRMFVCHEAESPRHGPPSPTEYAHHLEEALKFHRAQSE